MYTQSERDDMERLFDKLRYVGYVFLALHLVLNFPEMLEYIDAKGSFITNAIFLNIYKSFKKLPFLRISLLQKFFVWLLYLWLVLVYSQEKIKRLRFKKPYYFCFQVSSFTFWRILFIIYKRPILFCISF